MGTVSDTQIVDMLVTVNARVLFLRIRMVRIAATKQPKYN